MNVFLTVLLALAALPALLAPALAKAPPAVFPTPKKCSFEGGRTQVRAVRHVLRQPDSEGGMWKRLPAVPGGYAFRVQEGRLSVWANDEEGLYYAKQTISQLLHGVEGATNAQNDPFADMSLEEVAQLGELPLGRVIDWPDLTERGVVEGYYGTPWSTEARKSLFRFFGRNKMNLYIYGPKDDHYHHGGGCYEPYPKDKGKEIAGLVKAARESHVRFVWAIHPANTVDWNRDGGRPQLNQLCKKLEQMYKLGVRDFGVFVDDSFGEIGKPERQADVCNYILKHFIRKHPEDVTQYLIMVPTGYNRAWTNSEFLSTLGNRLDKSTRVMWTGDSVVNDITLPGQRWVHEQLGRPTFIWWNWPCSDFKRSRLSMGRTYGLGTEPEMVKEMSGFTANPMEQAEANKVGLFGVADYTWNITGFRSEESWREGIRRLYPECAESMQAFCDHNSYLLPNGHGYYREESVSMHETARAFIDSVNRWDPDEELALAMQEEYRRMVLAGKQLANPQKGASPELVALKEEIQPWFRAFAHTGRAGNFVIDAMLSEKKKSRREDFFRAVDSVSKMGLLTRMDWNNGYPKAVYDVEVASYIMVPALRAAFNYSNALVYSDFSGLKPTSLLPTFTTNAGNAGPGSGSEKIRDDNIGSYWDSGGGQQAGHWFCLDFGEPIPIMNVTLLMGTGERPADYPDAGVLEFSTDGRQWKPLGKEIQGSTVVLDLKKKPRRARMLRYRITKPRQHWLALAEFKVNCNPPTFATSSIRGFSGLTTFRDEKQYGINRVMEVHDAKPGDTVELHFPEPVKGSWLEVDFGNASVAQWGKVEVQLEDGRWLEQQGHMKGTALVVNGDALTKEAVISMRLTHQGKSREQVTLKVFKLDVPAVDANLNPKNLSDANFATYVDCSKGLSQTLDLPPGSRQLVVVGSAECTVNGKSGKRSGMAQYFPLEKGARRAVIRASAQKDKVVHEIIARTK